MEFQEYRNLLMKRGRLMKRKSKKQSGRSLIWKSILSNIERGHRVERKKKPEAAKKSGQPRTIVCRLKNWKQKGAVVRKAMKEKPVGLFICEDLSVATLEKRANQVEKLEAAKKAGKTAYFILDR